MPGIMANFCSNRSDGRIWAVCSTYLTLDRDTPGIGHVQLTMFRPFTTVKVVL